MMLLEINKTFKRWVLSFGLLASLFFLTSCTENTPIKIGFIGGLSGRVADLGTAGRNGFMLAIEEQNAKGGLHGRPIEVIYKDDQQQPQRAQALINDLLKENVDAIIGPMTSAMAMATVDQINEANKLMMACTVSTNKLTDLDDSFMRPLSDNQTHAAKMGAFIQQQEPLAKRAVAIVDIGNKAYTLDWVEGFKQAYESGSNSLRATHTFISTEDTPFARVANVAMKINPDLVVLAMNAVDATLMIKQIRLTNPDVVIAVAEWAGTERLIQLGGHYVENIYVPQYIDRSSTKESYLAFKKRFHKRFQSSPGFPALFCYDATRIVLTGLSKREGPQSLKEILLSIGSFEGTQGPITLNKYGDGRSSTFITRIQHGRFVVME